jgi:hypothetical protein
MNAVSAPTPDGSIYLTLCDLRPTPVDWDQYERDLTAFALNQLRFGPPDRVRMICALLALAGEGKRLQEAQSLPTF